MRPKPKWLQAMARARGVVYVVNDTQRIVCWNGGAAKLFGYSEAEVLNKPCYQIIGGKVCGKSWCHAGCAVQRSVKRGIPLQNFDMQISARDGEEISLSASVFTLARNGRRFSIHVLRDMTREEHTREALVKVLDTLQDYGISDGNRESFSLHVSHVHAASSRSPSVAELTPREIEVLELLAEGLSTREVAGRLGVSPFTVRSHVESILLKTGMHTQAQAVAYAYRAGLL
ncbi:MAG TPA: LuxR C-terminal-related transcriptional regulator [Terriglobia bacterium]|nr:LuxR C-terminal-related transcriptional regulator [Terriglobia bacterium]